MSSPRLSVEPLYAPSDNSNSSLGDEAGVLENARAPDASSNFDLTLRIKSLFWI